MMLKVLHGCCWRTCCWVKRRRMNENKPNERFANNGRSVTPQGRGRKIMRKKMEKNVTCPWRSLAHLQFFRFVYLPNPPATLRQRKAKASGGIELARKTRVKEIANGLWTKESKRCKLCPAKGIESERKETKENQRWTTYISPAGQRAAEESA